MTDISTLKTGEVRTFIQSDGPSPANPYEYVGCLSLGGISQDLGAVTPIYCPSPTQANTWDIVDEIPATKALPTTDFTQHMDRYLRDFWWDIRRQGCVFHGQVVGLDCTRPDDFNQWAWKIVLLRTKLTAFNLPELNPLAGDGNAVADLTGSLTMRDFDVIYPINFAQVADTTILAEVLDGQYYDAISCGECGTPSDGCQKAYVLTAANSGSPGLSSQIVHTDDNWATSSAVDIPTLGGNSGHRMAIAGSYLIVLPNPLIVSLQHHISSLSAIDSDDPSDFTAVSIGYVTAPQCIYVKSPTEVYIGGASGYIYFTSNPASSVSVVSDGSITAQDFNDVSGKGNVIVFVGDSNAIVASINAGTSFYAVTGPTAEAGVNVTAVEVIDKNLWWIGYADGTTWYTMDQGVTWTQKVIDATITIVNDIRFVNDVIGYMVVETSSGPRCYRTTDNGYTWTYTNTSPNIQGLPTAVRYNFVAPCGWNRVMAGGRETVGGDGMLAVAS